MAESRRARRSVSPAWRRGASLRRIPPGSPTSRRWQRRPVCPIAGPIGRSGSGASETSKLLGCGPDQPDDRASGPACLGSSDPVVVCVVTLCGQEQVEAQGCSGAPRTCDDFRGPTGVEIRQSQIDELWLDSWPSAAVSVPLVPEFVRGSKDPHPRFGGHVAFAGKDPRHDRRGIAGGRRDVDDARARARLVLRHTAQPSEEAYRRSLCT
jgi:hypothetical protein